MQFGNKGPKLYLRLLTFEVNSIIKNYKQKLERLECY